MELKLFTVLAACWWPFISCQTTVYAHEQQWIGYLGRVLVDSEEGTASFDWSGIEIETEFFGTQIGLMLNDPGNLYNIFVDGINYGILTTEPDTDYYMLAENLTLGTHILLLTKRTEAHFGIVTFGGFQMDGYPLPRKSNSADRQLEFLGASMTCGYGDQGTAPCSFSAATEDSWSSFGPVIARYFEADYHVESWSGKGVVKNAGSPNSTSPDPFPTYFDKTLANGNVTWDFSNWIPDAVYINLGTNDWSAAPYPTPEVFQEGFKNFVIAIQKAYSPSTPVFLACGPMIGDPCCSYIQNVTINLASVGSPVYYIDLPKTLLDYPQDYGCDGHPNWIGHQIIANTSIPYIQKVLDW